MTTATHSLGYAAGGLSPHRPLVATTVVSRTVRIGIAVVKVGAALTIAAAAVGFTASSLSAPSTPAGHAIVTPAPHQHTVLGRGELPILQLRA